MVMATPSPQQVGREFVRQYYTILHEAPELLHRFYSSGSMFVHGGVDRPGQAEEEPVVGQLEIDKKIRLLNFKDCHTKIRQVDAQLTIGNGVVVQVTGELSNNGEAMRRFMQTFVLAPQNPKKFYVHNDIFRYQDEVYQDLSDTESEEPQSTQQQQQATPQQVEVKTSSSTLNINYYQSSQNDTQVVQVEQEQVNVTTTIEANVQQEDQVQVNEQNILNGHLHSSSSSASSATPSEANQEKEEDKQSPEQEVTVVETQESARDVKQVKEEETTKVVETNTSVPLANKTNSWAKIISNKTDGLVSQTPVNNPTSTSNTLPRQKETKSVSKPQQPQQNGNLPKNQNKPRATNNHQENRQLNKDSEQQQHQAKPPRNNNNNTNQAQVQQNQVQVQQQTQQQQQQQQQQQVLNGNSDLDDIEKRFGRYPDGQQVFVGNLSQDISEAELKQFFSQFGKVLEVRINTNTKQQSGRRLPNYGFVVFEEKQAVDSVLGSAKSNNLVYKNEKGNDYRLNVEEKRARQARQSAGGYANNNSNKSRVTRSSSNGSRGGNNKKNFSQMNNDYGGDRRREGEVTGENGVSGSGSGGGGGGRKNNFRRS